MLKLVSKNAKTLSQQIACLLLFYDCTHFSSCVNIVITKYELKSQYVKLTQLWSLTMNCVLSLISQAYQKIVKNLSPLPYLDQMIIQQRFNVLL